MKTLVMLILLIFSFNALAHNANFIPDYYRDRRESTNYAAIGWSQRHELGLNIVSEKEKEEQGGTEQAVLHSTQLHPYVFDRLDNGINLEFQLLKTNGNIDDKTIPRKDDLDLNGLGLNVGYEVPTMPMAFGVSYNNAKADRKNSALGSISGKTTSLQLGGGYRLDNQIYLGAGLTHEHNNYYTSATQDVDTFALGAGKVYGDGKRPDEAAEALFTWSNELGVKRYDLGLQGLCNRGPIQYFSNVNLGFEDGDARDGLRYGLSVGADYQFGDYYVGPEVGYDAHKFNDHTKDGDLTASIEGGYRAKQMEFFLRLNLERGKETAQTAALDTKDNVDNFVLGGSYFF